MLGSFSYVLKLSNILEIDWYCYYFRTKFITYNKKIFGVKYYFFTFLPNIEGRWYLFRKSTKNRILLVKGNGRFLFHEDWNGLIFEKKIFALNKLQLFLYGTEKRYVNTLLTFILSWVALNIVYVAVDLELKHRYPVALRPSMSKSSLNCCPFLSIISNKSSSSTVNNLLVKSTIVLPSKFSSINCLLCSTGRVLK